jgi:hypothetical protein
MPTPNIPDEVVEAAVRVVAGIAYSEYSDHTLEGLREICRSQLKVALPLLLEQVGYAKQDGLAHLRESTEQSRATHTPLRNYEWAGDEPLYRLKVSNEQ